MFTVKKIYNEKKQAEQGKKYKIRSSRRKGAPGDRMKLNPVFKEINRLKESLILNGIKKW